MGAADAKAAAKKKADAERRAAHKANVAAKKKADVLPSSNPKPACFCKHSSLLSSLFCDHNEGRCTLASKCGGRWICRDSPTTIPTPPPTTAADAKAAAKKKADAERRAAHEANVAAKKKADVLPSSNPKPACFCKHSSLLSSLFC